MTVYLINIFLIIFEGLFLLYQNPTQSNKKKFCVLASLQWILISGLRHISIGADTVQYYNNFERVKTYSWSYVLDFARNEVLVGSDTKAPGYTLLVKIFQILSDDYQIFLIFVAIVFFTCMGIYIYKNSDNPAISFVLFSCLFYSFFAITGTRQTIATAVAVFLGTEFIKKKKPIPFIIIVLLMSTLHRSVLCFLPFYWIAKIKISKKSIIVYWVVTVIAYALKSRLFAVAYLLFGYGSYQQTEGARAGTFVFLLLLIALVISLFYKWIEEREKLELQDIDFEINESLLSIEGTTNEIPILQIATNGVFVAAICTSLLLVNENTMRVVQYFSLYLMIILPKLAKILANGRDIWFYNSIVTVVLAVLFVLNEPEYAFFWQNL